MRMRRIFLLFVVAIFAWACGEGSEMHNNGAAPEITISIESPLWLDSEHGIYEIGYSIKNPSTSLILDAKTNVDWASVIEIKDDVVSFVVMKNTEASERRGIVTLS